MSIIKTLSGFNHGVALWDLIVLNALRIVYDNNNNLYPLDSEAIIPKSRSKMIIWFLTIQHTGYQFLVIQCKYRDL